MTKVLRFCVVIFCAMGSFVLGGVASAGVPAKGGISHVVVINFENESYATTFGASSPATYLNKTLAKKGVLIQNYFGTAHVSLPNYIAEISGQAPTPTTQGDCIASYTDVTPGTPVAGSNALGQVNGSTGCVYPSAVQTIANQLDALHPPNATTHVASWRGYEEDMGNDATRDGGTACAHPVPNDPPASFATSADGYVTRHNPFVWFHSIIDNSAECTANVLPLGVLGSNNKPTKASPLVKNFSSASTTPAFSFITPSNCNNGHDETCVSQSAAGGTTGGLEAADAWLKAWMPTILNSPAYKSGTMMVVVTFDEADLGTPTSATACCNELSGPNVAQAGVSGPGGGQVGALILTSSKYIKPGTTDTKGSYNHYSALKSYENLLGITKGGSDNKGHLGMAGASGLAAFGSDVFNAK